MIKAIETKYKGYRFRSRLEARWAVFFDALGLDWEYEPEGFYLGDGVYYLPDFYLPYLGLFAEVKSPSFKEFDLKNNDWKKCAELARQSGKDVLFLQEIEYDTLGKVQGYSISPYGGTDKFCFSSCYRCFSPTALSISNPEDWQICQSCDNVVEFNYQQYIDSGEADALCDLRYAANKARSARFEHGECG